MDMPCAAKQVAGKSDPTSAFRMQAGHCLEDDAGQYWHAEGLVLIELTERLPAIGLEVVLLHWA